MPPTVISEDVPYTFHQAVTGELELNRPLGGALWWNSLYWTNFPRLSILDAEEWEQNPDAVIPEILKTINRDKGLSEQYITFTAAREDLCNTRPSPKEGCKLSVACLQYDGVRDCAWDFPLQTYMPRRDNHQPYDTQSRRFWDNGVIHLGLSALEFSNKVAPVGDLDACIHVADMAADQNPTWGYYHAVMRIGGWPYRIKRIGTFEGFGEGGHHELNIGYQFWDEKVLWKLLEGEPGMAPTGPNGEMEVQGNTKKGYKFWAQLVDLDWLGPKIDESKQFDPEVAPEKGYIWFTIEDTIKVPSTQQKGVKIKLLDEGIVPAWLDLTHLQVFAGSMPLGCLNELESDGPPAGSVKVCRVPTDLDDSVGEKKVVVENPNSRLVFGDPKRLQINDTVDLGWAIHDCCLRGCDIKVGPKPGPWISDVGVDSGVVGYKASGAPPLCHGEGANKVMIQVPKSDYPYERRLVM